MISWKLQSILIIFVRRSFKKTTCLHTYRFHKVSHDGRNRHFDILIISNSYLFKIVFEVSSIRFRYYFWSEGTRRSLKKSFIV